MKEQHSTFFNEELSEPDYEFLTPREVMNQLCIGRNTFYRLVNSGELPAFRIGKLWRVRKQDLNSFSIKIILRKAHFGWSLNLADTRS